MRRLTRVFGATVVSALLMAGLAAGPASAAFGLKELSWSFEEKNGSAAVLAGRHPYALTTKLAVNAHPDPVQTEIPDDQIKDLKIQFPPGMVGNPTAVPTCAAAAFVTIIEGGASCPNETAVGIAALKIALPYEPPQVFRVAVYNLEPSPGVAAKLGFVALNEPVTIDVGVNPDPPYNLYASLENIPQPVRFFGSVVTVWGNPSSSTHDEERGICAGGTHGSCPVTLPPKPFLTLPRGCSSQLSATFNADSWQNPGAWMEYPVAGPDLIQGCSELGFSPSVTAQPPSRSAGSASGLDFHLDIHDEGLTSVDGTAKSDIEKTVVTLPEGVTLNPSAADGLATCSEADLARETAASEPGAGCPQASKVGEVEVETPLLEGRLLKGSIFVATQDQNPFHSLLALYMVIKEPERGILVKLPGRVDADPKTGQLVTTFGEPPYEIPQFPFSHFRFHFREGPRAPLITPSLCGEYQTTAQFTPWARGVPPYTAIATFQVEHGVDGGPCPQGEVPPFHPGFQAGSINNAAGAFSPFYMRLTREDGEQDMTRFDSVLPPGVVGKIAGLGRCPEAAIAAAKQRTGREELAQPSCPASSLIGRTLAGAGVGSSLVHVPGSLYLAGPFGGDPLSVVAITPAVAGPFDVGTVVIREALRLNPETAEVEVDGAASDPIPHILQGIPLKLRDLRVYADRPDFTLNPTSCEPESGHATLFGSGADPFSSADDVPAALSARYQAADCASLSFKPRLSLRLKGGTRRGADPALTAILTPRPGDANIGGATVILPHSAFLDQAHIRTLCTRVQFNAGAGDGAECPAASIYGHVRAITPLLDEPLEGPVFLRSNGGERNLPDLVMALHGLIDVNVVGYIDSVNARIRTRFLSPPDAPVSKLVLKMGGGKRSLIENSRDICVGRNRATTILVGKNGRRYEQRPQIKARCGKAKKQRKAKRSGR